MYHLVLVAVLTLLTRWSKVKIFRFPRQGLFFLVFLIFMFVFQAFSGYGRIIYEQLPFGLKLTEEGLLQAFLFTLRAAILFLAFALAVFSTPRREVNFYFQQLNNSKKSHWRPLQKISRILMYVAYLLPESLAYRKTVVESAAGGSHLKIRERFSQILDQIYRFVHHLISRSEQEYRRFIISSTDSPATRPQTVFSYPHYLAIGIVMTVHLVLILNWGLS